MSVTKSALEPTSAATDQATVTLPESLLLPVDAKGIVSSADAKRTFERLQAKIENRLCFDCRTANARWMSTTFGVFLCVACSGIHRSMGSHQSFVRSTELDALRLEECVRMEIGGNERARVFFRSQSSTGDVVGYTSKAAERYRKILDQELYDLISRHRNDITLRGLAPTTENNFHLATRAAEAIQLDLPRITSSGIALDKSTGSSQSSDLVIKSAQLVVEPSDRTITHSAPRLFTTTRHTKTSDFDFDFEQAFESARLTATSQQTTAAVNSSSPSRNKTEYQWGESQLSPEVAGGKVTASAPRSVSSADYPRGNPLHESRSADWGKASVTNTQCFGNCGMGDDLGEKETSLASRMADQAVDQAMAKAADMAQTAHETIKSAVSWLQRYSTGI